MKRLKYLMITLVAIIILLTIGTSVKAVDGEVDTILLISQIIIEGEKNTYNTGDVITIDLKSSSPATVQDVPKLVIKFGNSPERTLDSITANGTNTDTWKYNYIIQSDDIGTLNVLKQKQNVTQESGGTGWTTVDMANISLSKAVTANSGSQPGQTQNPPVGEEDNDELTWTDGSKLNITIEKEIDGKTALGYLKVTGLNPKRNYFISVMNGQNGPVVPETGWIESEEGISISDKSEEKLLINKQLEKNGDLHVYIYESQVNKGTRINKKIVDGKKMERPKSMLTGTRINCFFFSDHTSTFLWESHDYDLKRNIKLKIGKVTDNSILRSIKNKEENALNKLLNYSKTASSIYTGTVPIGKSETITNNMNLVNEGYYYVYMVLNDENGKYYPVEDVSLYQARVDKSIGKNLWDYLDNNFKWNLSDEKPIKQPTKQPAKDNTTASGKLPQGGVYSTVVVLIIVVALIGILTFKKYRDLRDI